MYREGRKNMTEKIFKNNQVVVAGEIISDFEFSHEIFGEGFYTVKLLVNRLSDADDVIHEDLIKRMNQAYASIEGSKLRLTKSELAIMVAKHITHAERTVLLDVLSESCDVHLYGPDQEVSLSNVKWHGSF